MSVGGSAGDGNVGVPCATSQAAFPILIMNVEYNGFES